MITYSPEYKHGSTKYIAVHHTGPIGAYQLSKSQHLSAENVNAAHRDRWGFLSSLGFYGGYNFFIDKDGLRTQFRAVGEETAANKGFNYNGYAISICLAGNFTAGVEAPTLAQVQALRMLFSELPSVSAVNVVPHWGLQNTTSCYGSGLSEGWAREEYQLSLPTDIGNLKLQISLYEQLVILWRRIRAAQKSLGSLRVNCDNADLRG